jgi:hypothetical protein
MRVDKTTALLQIDAVFARRAELSANWVSENVQEVTTLSCAAIRRLSPPGSAYLEQMELVIRNTQKSVGRSRDEEVEYRLRGILSALRADYDAGRLQTFEELIHADVFSGFLEMSEYFSDEGYKDAAAMIAGGVLEEHLRKLCARCGITYADRPNLNTMNADLAKKASYTKNDQQQVTAWARYRNDAAHANYGNYTSGEVKLMIAAIRDFISRNPA